MLKKKSLVNNVLIFVLLAILSPLSIAEKKNNDSPVNQAYAIKIASVVVNKLAKGKKIHKTWLNISPKSAIIRQYPHGKEWVIAFENRKVERQVDRTLYIFLTISGKYVAANYTGQ